MIQVTSTITFNFAFETKGKRTYNFSLPAQSEKEAIALLATDFEEMLTQVSLSQPVVPKAS